MSRRHEPIPPLRAYTIKVYRCHPYGRRYHSIDAAYRAAAREAWRAADYCGCEPGDDVTPPSYCGWAEHSGLLAKYTD